MNNAGIANNIYQVILDEITSVVNVEDQKDIATYVVNDLIHRYDIGNNVAEKLLNINNISRVCNGKQMQAGLFVFKFN